MHTRRNKIKNLKLKGAIVESGLNYVKLAHKINVSKQTIDNAVSFGNISNQTAMKIALALNKTVECLFTINNNEVK